MKTWRSCSTGSSRKPSKRPIPPCEQEVAMASMRTLIPIDYPSSDGKPMAETPLHLRVLWDLIETLVAWFGGDPMVYVWGNMFLYYVEGDASKNVSPDVMVVKVVPKDKFRDTFTF